MGKIVLGGNCPPSRGYVPAVIAWALAEDHFRKIATACSLIPVIVVNVQQ